MKLVILASGKAGRSPEGALSDRYLKRIGWPVELRETGDSAKLPGRFRLKDGDVRTVVLDERGESLSSTAFAQRLQGWREDGAREIRFLIGPADGHDDATRQEADLLLSFGAATWPHLLVRAMLAEQLYRAVSILGGHPYHRDG